MPHTTAAAAACAALCLLLLAVATPASRAAPVSDTAAPVACACPRIYAPVCGSDGKTYPNDCPIVKCGDGSVTVASQGPCATQPVQGGAGTAGTTSNPASTSQPTTQRPRQQQPAAVARCRCNRMYAPICATNAREFNRTFASECVMRCSPGTWTVLREGPCSPADRGARAAEQKPACACPYILAPVCALNAATGVNRTFSNECMATKCAVGAWTVVAQGACTRTPRRQGGFLDAAGGAAAVGRPQLRPQGTSAPCVCDRTYRPVCARNINTNRARTFTNPCQVERCANGAFRVLYEGICQPADLARGTRSPRPGTDAGVASTQPPVACACPAIWRPTCGSDGKTYDNDCLLTRCRVAGGPVVAYEGPCKADAGMQG